MASASLRPGMGARDLAVAAAMNILWGLNIVAVKVAVGAVAPLTAGLLRQGIVFAVCAGSLRIVPGRMRPLLILGALAGGFFFIANNLAIRVSDNIGALAIAGQLGVPFSLLLAILIFRERVHWPRMLGIALSFAGVVLLVFDPAAADEGAGLALIALASLIWAIGLLIQRKLVGVPVPTIYAWVGLMGVVVLAPCAWAFEPEAVRGIPAIRMETMGWIAFSAIGSTVLGQGSMAWLLQRHPVSAVVPLTLAAPVISVVAASWYFGTPITAIMVLGGLIALAGVAIIAIRSARTAAPVAVPAPVA
ncbi:DMT family transporter [Sphingomonas sp.]|jgi:O-acetylserine/cysteine efflux transporter|uniref:DMT family transporter n=1 Tax=Sphingomonas sp. TaxID=28214 RepID=UPI002ED77319